MLEAILDSQSNNRFGASESGSASRGGIKIGFSDMSSQSSGWPEAIKVIRDKISSIRQAAQALLADKDDVVGAPSPKGATADADVEMEDA